MTRSAAIYWRRRPSRVDGRAVESRVVHLARVGMSEGPRCAETRKLGKRRKMRKLRTRGSSTSCGRAELLRGGLPQRGMHKSAESSFIEATLVLPERRLR